MSAPSEEVMEKEILDMRAELNVYKPGQRADFIGNVVFPNLIHIGLFGKTGCGKTSLINSLVFALQGTLRSSRWLPVATSEKQGGHTLERKLATLCRDKLFVIDNRGLDDFSNLATQDEILAQIDGKRDIGTKFSWKVRVVDQYEDPVQSPVRDPTYPIGCVVLVFSVLHDYRNTTDGLQQIIGKLQSKNGRYPVAVITNVDRGTPEQIKSLKVALRLTGVSEIFEVANLTLERRCLETSYQHTLLLLLDRCITDADETVVFKYHNEQREKYAKMKRDRERAQKEEADRKLQEEKERREREKEYLDYQCREETQRRVEAEEKQEKMEKVAAGMGVVGSTATGAAVGAFGGPVGLAVGAGIGAAVGIGGVIIRKILK